tara:strand:+ start:688 stop:942 length:255 start_codon:yes stop_codon:yes gene_type:complete
MITEEKSRLRKAGEYALRATVTAGLGLIGAYFIVDAASRTNEVIYVDPRSCYADTEQGEERIFRKMGDYCLGDRNSQIPIKDRK